LRSLVFLAFPALCGDALRIICAQCFPSIWWWTIADDLQEWTRNRMVYLA
jgi:hypothetical protein